MRSTITRNKDDTVDTLKLTSLLYLQEALEGERYEDCAELIQSAQDLGVQRSEISEVIGAYVRTLQGNRPNEANRLGRRRFS